MEIPLTTGLLGTFRPIGSLLYPWLDTAQLKRMHLTGAFARARLLERIRLTPEGSSLAEAKRLSRVLFRDGRAARLHAVISQFVPRTGLHTVRANRGRS